MSNRSLNTCYAEKMVFLGMPYLPAREDMDGLDSVAAYSVRALLMAVVDAIESVVLSL